MNARIVRRTLFGVVLLTIIVRMSFEAIIVATLWGVGEGFLLAKRHGRKGIAVFSLLAVIVVSSAGYQAYAIRGYLLLISRIKELGADRADMSGQVLPGPVGYISLGSNVGDAELERIAALDGLDRLESVVAVHSPISDKGLLCLRKFKRLDRIYLGGTHVTPDGVSALQQHLPRCSIVYDPRN